MPWFLVEDVSTGHQCGRRGPVQDFQISEMHMSSESTLKVPSVVPKHSVRSVC